MQNHSGALFCLNHTPLRTINNGQENPLATLATNFLPAANIHINKIWHVSTIKKNSSNMMSFSKQTLGYKFQPNHFTLKC